MKKQIRECLPMFHMPLNYIHQEELLLWSIDTDVAAICPRAILLLDIRELYFKTDVKNKKRFIPMHAVSSEIGHIISLVMPVAHALTGCDSNSAFSGIGERSMLNILKSDERVAEWSVS